VWLKICIANSGLTTSKRAKDQEGQQLSAQNGKLPQKVVTIDSAPLRKSNHST